MRRVRAHSLYLAFAPDGPVLVAVLHYRMDLGRHLRQALDEVKPYEPCFRISA
jgi:hypothetical protein